MGIFLGGWKQFNGPRGRALTQNQVEKSVRMILYGGGRIGAARCMCSTARLTGSSTAPPPSGCGVEQGGCYEFQVGVFEL